MSQFLLEFFDLFLEIHGQEINDSSVFFFFFFFSRWRGVLTTSSPLVLTKLSSPCLGCQSQSLTREPVSSLSSRKRIYIDPSVDGVDLGAINLPIFENDWLAKWEQNSSHFTVETDAFNLLAENGKHDVTSRRNGNFLRNCQGMWLQFVTQMKFFARR